MNEPFHIRAYQPSDEAVFYSICLRTCDQGQDGAHLHSDPSLIGHWYIGPYFHLPYCFGFALLQETNILGYLLACADTLSFHQAFRAQWLPSLQDRYPLPPLSPSARPATQALIHRLHHPTFYLPPCPETHPAHFHLDLLPTAQSKGNGSQLLQHLFQTLQGQNIPGIHLEVHPQNQRAIRFYEKHGFHALYQPDENALLMGKRLH